MLKVEAQENLIKINSEIIEQEEKEWICQERLEDYYACIHGEKENSCVQCKKEQDIFRQLEILP